MKMGLFAITLFFVFSLSLIQDSKAASLDVKPGQWNFIVLIETPHSDNPIIQNTTRCFNKSEMNPFKSFNVNHERIGCDLNNVEVVDGKSVDWRWFCEGNDVSPKTNGKGQYISSGSQINGFLKTAHYEDGNLIKTNVTLQGEYIGDCAEENEGNLIMTKR